MCWVGIFCVAAHGAVPGAVPRDAAPDSQTSPTITNIPNHHKHHQPSQGCVLLWAQTHSPSIIPAAFPCRAAAAWNVSESVVNETTQGAFFPTLSPSFPVFFFLFFWCVCLFSVVHKVVEPVSSLSNAGVCSAASSLLTKIHQHHTLTII